MFMFFLLFFFNFCFSSQYENRARLAVNRFYSILCLCSLPVFFVAVTNVWQLWYRTSSK